MFVITPGSYLDDADQVEMAAALLEVVKRELYAILANGPTRDEHGMDRHLIDAWLMPTGA